MARIGHVDSCVSWRHVSEELACLRDGAKMYIVAGLATFIDFFLVFTLLDYYAIG